MARKRVNNSLNHAADDQENSGKNASENTTPVNAISKLERRRRIEELNEDRLLHAELSPF